MKWFWLGILALTILAATLLLARRSAMSPGPVSITQSPTQPSQASPLASDLNTRPLPPEPTKPIAASPTTTDDRPNVNIAAQPGGFVVTPKSESPQPTSPEQTQPISPAATITPTKPDATKSIDTPPPHEEAMKSITDDLAALLAGENPKPKDLAPAASSPGATAPTGAPTTAPIGTMNGASPDQATAPAKITPQDDGSLLIDNRFVLKGKGTKDDPYRVSWEQLVSANESYQPRLGRTIIPDRLKMLDGKFVRISGYIAFPIMAQSADEMLVMLNQWDGCCIGVPPTPYDAIEVKLKTAAKGDIRQRMSGTVTGVLRVDPYLVKGWLVSLFLMDEGELGDMAGNAAPGQHAPNK